MSLASILEGLGLPKSLIFNRKVVISEVFLIFHLTLVWGVSVWPLGASWGSLGTLLAAFLVVLGPLGELLGSLASYYEL